MPPLPLHYANSPNRRRRRIIKWAIIATLLTTISIAGFHYGPHAYQFARQSYWQRQCMNFNPPPGTVVYERLPKGSPKPATAPLYMDGNSPEVTALTYSIGEINWGLFPSKFSPNDLYRVPICWVRFMQATGTTQFGGIPPSLVFCHQLISPAGHRRLVTVQYPSPTTFSDIGQLLPREMMTVIFLPVTWNRCPELIPDVDQGDWDGNPLPMPRRIFAGQPDPADASHFTIEYEWPNGLHGIVDGHLLDNDMVDLKIRPGPGDIESAVKARDQDYPSHWNEYP